MAIRDYIPTGKKNAITARALKRILSLRHDREVTKLIQAERLRGVPICATSDRRRPGYYRPANMQEMIEYKKTLIRRMNEIHHTYTAMDYSNVPD